MNHPPTLPDLPGLAPADRFLFAAHAKGLRWYWSRPDQAYGVCPICGGNAALGLDDGSAGFTCFRGCRTADVLDALELPGWALFTRGSRGPTVDLASRKMMATAESRTRDLDAHREVVDLVARLEKIAPWALSIFGAGLLTNEGLSFPERNHRGQVTANTIIVPKSLRDRVDGPAKRVEPGGRRGLVYPMAGLVKNDDAVVVEGAMGAVAAASLGRHQVIALPSASWKFSAAGARSFFADRAVKLIPDADPQGRAAMERVADSAMEAGARSVGIVDLHPGREDGRDLADDLREHGREAASELLATAIGRTTFTQPNRSRGRPPKSLSAAESYLKQALADGGWHPVTQVNADAPTGISTRTLARARDVLGVQARKFGTAWHICLKRA